MLLQVGELAKRTGLTVRTLHHYDALDLLKPSARSDAGYRLYNRDNVARLHAIQALRQVGMPLKEIADLLAGAGESLPTIIQRQLIALDWQITRANALREQLKLLQEKLIEGSEPDMNTWLSVIERMAIYGKYFSSNEIKRIFDNFKHTESLWPQLVSQVREHMKLATPPESPSVQALARRWMDLTHVWMGGDKELIARWNHMYQQEPSVQGRHGVDLSMAHYIYAVIGSQMTASQKDHSLHAELDADKEEP